nr:hypothetical protein [Marinobacter sp. DS40M8]
MVKNQEISFRILEDGSGGNLSSSLDVTDSQGRASTIYTAGSNTSGRDGVEIEAVVDGSISDTVTLTVARQALRLAIGTGNEIEEPDSVRYVKEYVAIVTDANGAPVENANIELSALPVGYRKGSYAVSTDDNWYCPLQTHSFVRQRTQIKMVSSTPAKMSMGAKNLSPPTLQPLAHHQSRLPVMAPPASLFSTHKAIVTGYR